MRWVACSASSCSWMPIGPFTHCSTFVQLASTVAAHWNKIKISQKTFRIEHPSKDIPLFPYTPTHYRRDPFGTQHTWFDRHDGFPALSMYTIALCCRCIQPVRADSWIRYDFHVRNSKQTCWKSIRQTGFANDGYTQWQSNYLRFTKWYQLNIDVVFEVMICRSQLIYDESNAIWTQRFIIDGHMQLKWKQPLC